MEEDLGCGRYVRARKFLARTDPNKPVTVHMLPWNGVPMKRKTLRAAALRRWLSDAFLQVCDDPSVHPSNLIVPNSITDKAIMLKAICKAASLLLLSGG
jgi:hypothetical protein